MTNSLDSFRDGYATYEGFSDYSYKCISYLMDATTGNELIWRLLYYNDANAWNQTTANPMPPLFLWSSRSASVLPLT